jgi:hypothetical protein
VGFLVNLGLEYSTTTTNKGKALNTLKPHALLSGYSKPLNKQQLHSSRNLLALQAMVREDHPQWSMLALWQAVPDFYGDSANLHGYPLRTDRYSRCAALLLLNTPKVIAKYW